MLMNRVLTRRRYGAALTVAIAMAATAWVGCEREVDGPPLSIGITERQAIVNVTRVAFQPIVPTPGRGPSYRWDFGDGEQGSGYVVEHVYRMEGKLLVKLTLEDSLGTMTAHATVEVR